MEEEKYYLWYIDIFGDLRFIIRMGYPSRLQTSAFVCENGIADLNFHVDNNIQRYKLTKDEIMALPEEWIPAIFDGKGFTKCRKVKDVEAEYKKENGECY